MWRAFLENIGAEVVVSEDTNRQVILWGASRVVSDTCLPVKVFVGHVSSLIGKCDRILIPVVRSTREKVYNCSRFLGLPDMTRAVLPETPPILEIEFDLSRGRSYLYRQIYSLGSHFTRNPLKIRKAALESWEIYKRYRDIMPSQGLTRVKAIELVHGPTTEAAVTEVESDMTIGLAGHPYVLHDDQVSHQLIKRLRNRRIRVITPEMVPPVLPDKNDGVRPGGLGRTYWESEEDMIDAVEYYVNNKVDGIIGMMAFSCGPDSLMMHLVQRRAQDAGIPFMCLTVEEHTAEAGIMTRLEAYLDMVTRRMEREG
jgi:predicted nucleotide-binding protein (sugar kinase/HSP70/actin superfamily)